MYVLPEIHMQIALLLPVAAAEPVIGVTSMLLVALVEDSLAEMVTEIQQLIRADLALRNLVREQAARASTLT
jgi:hypothetical protein